jgi:glucosamine--fructose-6-phosphate aminotransferase (isomerizing)
LPLIEGQYAFAVLHAKHPGQIVAARQGSPLVLGRAAQEGFVASDVPAMLDHSREVVHLADGHIASVGPGRLSIRDAAGRIVEVIPQKIEWSIEDAQRGGFDHFMLKEIHDTPAAIHAALLGRLDTIAHKAPVEGELDPSSLHAIERVRILACGSSYYAALASKRALEELARIPVHVEVASEFRHASTPAMPGTLSLAITQSGETIDTLGALRKARQQGDLTIAVTNVVGSSATREAHATMLLQAGPEISVAATKSFTSQLVAMHLLALHLGSVRRSLGAEPLRTWSHHLRTLPRAVQRVLDRQRPFQQAGQALSASGSVLYIGRQAGHALAMEGALKLKEVSYLHAEGFAAGELKHGPLALVSEGVPVVAVVPPDGSHGAMLSNLSEVGARDGHVLALAQEGDLEVAKVARTTLGIPPVPDLLFPVPASVGLQLMAYHAARALQRPIDRPRNLAKSVTVE